MNKFTAPNANSCRSAHAIVEIAATVKNKKAIGWQLQRNVPTQVALNIAREVRARAAKGIID